MAKAPNLSNLRIPPHHLESEQAVLGALMLRPAALHEVMDVLTPDMFYVKKHAIVYQTILDLSNRGEPIDVLSIAAKLKERKTVQDVGGASYLSELMSGVPSTVNVRHYAEIVYKKYILRSLIDSSEQIASLAYEENDMDAATILDTAEKSIFRIASSLSTKNAFISIKQTLVDAWEQLEHLHEHKDELRGVPTGYEDLDNLIAGLQPSDLIILAARPSMGKTTFALDMVRNVALKGIPVGIFSLEMSAQQLVNRMLSAESRVDAWSIRTGHGLTAQHFSALQEAASRLQKAPIYIDDQAGNSIVKMRSVARRLKSEHGLGLIVIDYLQLMTTSKNYDNMVNQVTEISRSLKQLARELDVPVLALSQLSRAVESRGGRPRLSDLRDSGCLTGDTLIQRADTGERVPIKSLVGQTNIPILSLDSTYTLRPMFALKVFSSGRKRVFNLITRSGRTIKASANHKFLTLAGWQRLDTLQEGDRLALPRLITATNPNPTLSVDEIVLLAHLIGDGCVLPRQPIHYTSADPANLDAVEKAASTLFGITPRRIQQKNWWHSYLPSPYRLTRGVKHPITRWYEELGLQPVRSYEKRLPKALFTCDLKTIQLFLHHLWATDGNISWKRLPGRKPSAAIYYATTSRGLAEDVQHLLLKLGIWSTVRTSTKKGFRPCYHVHIQSMPVQEQFLTLVGSYGTRGKIVKELKKAISNIATVPNTDTIPADIWNLLVAPEKDSADESWRGLAEKLDTAYNGTALTATGISRPRLAKIARALSSDSLMHLAESDVYWDEVIGIEQLGIEEVYDASVPGTHNFVAGDIIVHNSIEQDADLVMFIHNEDRFKEHHERTNITEILIEKHRNGPVGMVKLLFDAKTTSFLPVDKTHESFKATSLDDF